MVRKKLSIKCNSCTSGQPTPSRDEFNHSLPDKVVPKKISMMAHDSKPPSRSESRKLKSTSQELMRFITAISMQPRRSSRAPSFMLFDCSSMNQFL